MKIGGSRSLVPPLAVAVLIVLAGADGSEAYVWRCHQPGGDTWTSQPPESGDCEEYDPIYNPDAAPPPAWKPQPQPAPPSAPPPAPSLPPPPSAWPYDPFLWPHPYPYYPGYWWPYAPGVYVTPPLWQFQFGPRPWYRRHR